jgi:hypothetical protein
MEIWAIWDSERIKDYMKKKKKPRQTNDQIAWKLHKKEGIEMFAKLTLVGRLVPRKFSQMPFRVPHNSHMNSQIGFCGSSS